MTTPLDTIEQARRYARIGAELVAEPVEDIVQTLIEDPSTVEYLRALAASLEAKDEALREAKERHVRLLVDNLEWALDIAALDPLYAEMLLPSFKAITAALAARPSEGEGKP